MTELLYTGQFLQLFQRPIPHTENGRWEYVSRVNAKGAVTIIATTAQQEIILVEQYRVPLAARTLEMPAGIVGDQDPHESFETAALRELLEETGYQSQHARTVLVGPTAPGLSSEMIHFVRIENAIKVGEGGGVDDEDIHVHVVPLAEVRAWLQAQSHLLIEPRVYTGLYFVG